MLDALRKELYLKRINLKLWKGLKEGKIKAFDEEFYEKLKHTYINGIPVYMYIKYLKPFEGMPGQCFDRSLMMFLCFDDALLVRGDNWELALKFGQNKAYHGWIEIGNYVYDATLLMRFDKDLYYDIYRPLNIVKYDKEGYCQDKDNKEFYEGIKEMTINKIKNDFNIRVNLITLVPLIRGIAKMTGNLEFLKELEEYLALINYDELEIIDKLDETFLNTGNDLILK